MTTAVESLLSRTGGGKSPGNEAAGPRGECVHRLFEAQAARAPDAVAVEWHDRELTYHALDVRATRVARHLQALGVGPDVRVGICIERSLEMVVGLLGILKAGGAYLPLDPAYPGERLGYMLEDAGAPVLLTRPRMRASLPPLPARIQCVDVDDAAASAGSAEHPVAGVSAENLAYVIYTSGSTGKPKGVAMGHRPLVNLIRWQLDSSTVPAAARTLQFTSLSFDVSFQEIFATLCGGGTLVLVDDEVRRDAGALLRFLSQKKVERLFLPFVALQQLGEVARGAAAVPTHLREIITAGEQLQISEPVADLLTRLPGCTLHNHYGPSEAHVVTAYPLTGAPESWPLLPPIGRPIANTQIHLLDAAGKPVPAGEPGELYIGGLCLARGYLGRPELTAERFVASPFGPAGGRLYRTGDLARALPDGNIEFLGRIDHQVKIRGYRIELGEIEATLSQHPGVRESVVTAREEGEKRLVAYVVGAAPASPGAGELRAFLRERLPEYMVPAAFVPLAALPLTPSGKVDRKALPAPAPAAPERDGLFAAPRDPVEAQLAQIWETILGVSPIGSEDHFFDLGGHSLLAVRLFTEISRRWGRELPLATLFQAPTVAQLARLLREEDAAPSACLVPIRPLGTKPPFFCLHGAGAHVIHLEILARHLSPDQPFYGVQSQGLDGKLPPHTRVEEMAAHYLQEIRAVQAEGPYYFGGYSFGGVVAFEMAQQLHAQGERVALLALLNTFYPQRPPHLLYATPFHIKGLRTLERVERHRDDWVGRGPGGYALDRLLGFKQKLRGRARWALRRFQRADPAPGNAIPPTIRKVWDLNLKAEKAYVPQPYPGRLTLFWAGEVAPLYSYRVYGADNRLAWSEVAGEGLEVHLVPGDTASMRSEPHVRVLAEKLTACLERAQSLRFP